MNEPARHIVCPSCDAINRVPVDKPAGKAKCGRCHDPLFSGKPLAVSGRSFATHIERNDIPVVADFWAEWCGPCKAMAPAFERVAAELEPEIRFLKVDTEAEQQLAAQYSHPQHSDAHTVSQGKDRCAACRSVGCAIPARLASAEYRLSSIASARPTHHSAMAWRPGNDVRTPP